VHTPGLKVVAASTPQDARGLLKAAIRDPDPVLFFEHKLLYGLRAGAGTCAGGSHPDPDPDPGPGAGDSGPVPLGVGRVLREGTDVTVVSYLKTLHYALEAAEQVAAEGISCEVWDPRSLVPLDRDGLCRSIEKTGRLVVAHEAPVRGGFGAEIASIAAEQCFDLLRAPVLRVGGLNSPVPYAPEMEAYVLPGKERIADAIRRSVSGEPRRATLAAALGRARA
jgi:pyruvate/2-oxoglutarate/acetoin dehydrogenase E1 component